MDNFNPPPIPNTPEIAQTIHDRRWADFLRRAIKFPRSWVQPSRILQEALLDCEDVRILEFYPTISLELLIYGIYRVLWEQHHRFGMHDYRINDCALTAEDIKRFFEGSGLLVPDINAQAGKSGPIIFSSLAYQALSEAFKDEENDFTRESSTLYPGAVLRSCLSVLVSKADYDLEPLRPLFKCFDLEYELNIKAHKAGKPALQQKGTHTAVSEQSGISSNSLTRQLASEIANLAESNLAQTFLVLRRALTDQGSLEAVRQLRALEYEVNHKMSAILSELRDGQNQ